MKIQISIKNRTKITLFARNGKNLGNVKYKVVSSERNCAKVVR